MLSLILFPTTTQAVPTPEGAKATSEYIKVKNNIVYDVYYLSLLEGCVWGTGYAFAIEAENLITCKVYKERSDGWYKGVTRVRGLDSTITLFPTEAPTEREYEAVHGYVVCERKLDVKKLKKGKYAYLRTMKITYSVYKEDIKQLFTDRCEVCTPPKYKYIELPEGVYIAYVEYDFENDLWGFYFSFDLTKNEELIDNLPIAKVFTDPMLTLAYVTKTITHIFRLVLST